MDDHEMLKWGGINMGDREAYLLWHSMKRLAAVSGAENLRFCGKIFGTKADYWIMSGCKPSSSGQEMGREVEERGSGINYHVYYVANHLL